MPLPVLVPMKTSFPSAKALKLFTWLTVSASKLNLSQIMFFFTERCHFQLSNIRITKRWWLAGDDDYLRGATSINHQVALRANFKIYSRSAKGGEKGNPNRKHWLAKMLFTRLNRISQDRKKYQAFPTVVAFNQGLPIFHFSF